MKSCRTETTPPFSAKSLWSQLSPLLDLSFNHHSRVHPLLNFSENDQTPVLIKREDELNSGVVGGKIRKYMSLLPMLKMHDYQQVIAIGSAHSNNVMGLAQIARQQGYELLAFVKKPGDSRLQGNLLLTNMLLAPSDMHLIEPQQWFEVEAIARNHAETQLTDGKRVFVIPEGGDCQPVLPGILTLALDLLENESDQKTHFRDIWIDAGTGISAIGLLLGLRLLDQYPRRIHITLIAGNEQEFMQRYNRYQPWAEQLTGQKLPPQSFSLIFHPPVTARSYGSINQRVIKEVVKLARSSGLLVDPLYSAKHLLTVREALKSTTIREPQLVIYNGGPLGLAGFQSQIENMLH
ncbi:MAG: pyridoxal-phosphate dependent enzyme [Gammaproteobacteria bacterium]|nr:pyridoxal-phosphate dependent enzyme [Gammaproteobacteria bacterium]